MDIAKSVSYIFEDDEWVTKIAIMLAVSLGAGLSFLLVGLVFVAAQIGWTMALIRNIKDDVPNPMPSWEGFGEKIADGATPLGAGIIYAIIPLILFCGVFILPTGLLGIVSEEAAGLAGGAVTCIGIPLLILYVIPAALFYNLGLITYVDTREISSFLKFTEMWDMLMANRDLTIRYILFLVLVQIAMNAIASTGIGGLATAAFTVPITGHLTGQYAALLGGKRKRAEVA